MSSINEYIFELGKNAKKTTACMARLDSDAKNEALLQMAAALEEKVEIILEVNKEDLKRAKEMGIKSSLIERLSLNEERVYSMADGLRELVKLADPIGNVVKMWRRPNGLEIGQVRVPLGVVAIIYESRPNVTVDAVGLSIKTGNAIILRGGSEALQTNKTLVKILREALTDSDVPVDAIQLVDIPEREAVMALMKMNQYLDLLIPRGGAGLIKTVINNSTVPVIETGVGNCHIFIDSSAEIESSRQIIINAKVQRPSVCNAVETLLIHQEIAPKILPFLGEDLKAAGVEIRGCQQVRKYIPWAKEAAEEDWSTEYLDLILAIKVVSDLEEALSHIAKYGTQHSESILTTDYNNARNFLHAVDAAAVYVNASTRFTDGYQFGLGAELGISTQKLHARGPMGLEALTTLKYIIYGNGQIRK